MVLVCQHCTGVYLLKVGGVGIIDWAAWALSVGQYLSADMAQVGNELGAGYQGHSGRSRGFVGWVSPRFGEWRSLFEGVHAGRGKAGGCWLVFVWIWVTTRQGGWLSHGCK